MIQKEVAQRIISQPPKMNLLAASVQFYAKPEIICYVPKTAFSPKPKIDSAIIRITPIKTKRNINRKFFKTIKAGFKQPRKLLINNLSDNLKIEKENIKKAYQSLNIPLKSRAQNLSIDKWISLSLLLIEDNV
jgi:16S rRNA (adenine1518-N6/adenine1519-N6)-dimethyltransferase